MSDFLFSPPPPPAAPIRGQAQRFPIHRIFCVGRNYEAHAKEMGGVVDREAPFYFTKSSIHYAPSGSTIAYSPGTTTITTRWNWSSRSAGGISDRRSAGARARIWHACGLDMTRRDLQAAAKEKQRPWDIAKDVEQSAVLGDISPAAEIGHPTHARIELRVNGQTKQSADVSQLIHNVPAVIAHLSQYYHLRTGDLIYAGTPEGVGPVKPGDRLGDRLKA